MVLSSTSLIPAYTIDPTAPDFTFEKAADVVVSLTQAIDSHEDPDLRSLWDAISQDLLYLRTRVEESGFLVARSDRYLRNLDEAIAMFEANYEDIKRCACADEPWTDEQLDKLKAWTGASGYRQYDDTLKGQVQMTKTNLAVAIDTRMSLLDTSLLDEAPKRLSAKSIILTRLPTPEDVRGGRWDLASGHERDRRLRAHSLAWPEIQHIPSVASIPDSRVPFCIDELRKCLEVDSPSGPTTPEMDNMLELLDSAAMFEDDTIFPRGEAALRMLPSVIASFLTVDLDKHTETRTSFTDRQRDLLLSKWGSQAGH